MVSTAPPPIPPQLNYRFAFTPRWLFFHALALVALATMVTAGFWQLDRLHTKQARNRLLDERAALPAAAVESVLRPTDDASEATSVTYRAVHATGTFVPEQEVFVRNRSLNGAPGAWVLTPLRLADGSALVVNRGWVPASSTTPVLPSGAEAPVGQVTVEGLLMPSQRRGRIGATDPAEGRLAVLARADVERLQHQVDEDLYPLYLQAFDGGTAAGSLPAALPLPERSEGPHLGYAIQWFCFATIWLVGYPMLVRRSALDRARGPHVDGEGQPGV